MLVKLFFSFFKFLLWFKFQQICLKSLFFFGVNMLASAAAETLRCLRWYFRCFLLRHGAASALMVGVNSAINEFFFFSIGPH